MDVEGSDASFHAPAKRPRDDGTSASASLSGSELASPKRRRQDDDPPRSPSPDAYITRPEFDTLSTRLSSAESMLTRFGPPSHAPPHASSSSSSAPPPPAAFPFALPFATARGVRTRFGFDVEREVERLVAVLPPRKESCDHIWGCYKERLEWWQNVVRPSAFEALHDRFWAWREDREVAIEIEEIALVFAVMEAGLGTMRPVLAVKLEIASDTLHWRTMGAELRIASERALSLCDFGRGARLEVVQTLLLHCYRTLSLEPQGWFHLSPILALTARLAHTIGLSNVPPTPALEDELRRRVWFNVVMFDWRYSTGMGDTYLVQAAQFNTALPASAEWGDLERLSAAGGLDVDMRQWNRASLWIAKVHLAALSRELTDKINALYDLEHVAPSAAENESSVHKAIYENEQHLQRLLGALPDVLYRADAIPQGASDGGAVVGNVRIAGWSRVGFQLQLDLRILQLHRPFVCASYRTSRSRGVCLDAAERLMSGWDDGRHGDNPLYCWWYGYIASVVLFMEQFYADAYPASDAVQRLDEKLHSIAEYIRLQSEVEEMYPAQPLAALFVLSTLYATLAALRTAQYAAHPPSSRPLSTRIPPLIAALQEQEGGSGIGDGARAFCGWARTVLHEVFGGAAMGGGGDKDAQAALLWNKLFELDLRAFETGWTSMA